MNRENFIKAFKPLYEKYPTPKHNFTSDDYFKQVRYIDDKHLDAVIEKVIATCRTFPVPQQLADIAKEFKSPFKKQKKESEINYDDCQIKHKDGSVCGEPVYKSLVDPYRCKKHYEQHLEEMKKTGAKKDAVNWYENGPFEIPDTPENAPLKKALTNMKLNYGF